MLNYESVKVFSATKFKDREALGDRLTEWIQSNRVEIVDKVVSQSSDSEFHCLTITLFYRNAAPENVDVRPGAASPAPERH